MDIFGMQIGAAGGGVIDWALFSSVISYGFMLLILIGCVFLIMRVMLFNHKVIIRIKRGNSEIITEDLGAVRKDENGSKRIFLMKARTSINQVPFEYIKQTTGGRFNKGVIELYKYGEDDYTPINSICDATGVKLVPMEPDISHYRITMEGVKNKYDIMKKGWQTYMPIVLQMGGYAVLFLSVLFLANTLKDASGAIAGVAGSMADTADVLKTSIQQMNECRVAGSMP